MERQKEFVRALGRAARNIEHGLYGHMAGARYKITSIYFADTHYRLNWN